jgi:hypothetical protein
LFFGQALDTSYFLLLKNLRSSSVQIYSNPASISSWISFGVLATLQV